MSLAAELAETFGADGLLAAQIPGFAVRDEQVAMAITVATALTDREHCVIEAGTGIGKTFAYMVPTLFAGKRVVVSTGTRTLQDQLFHRDLPIIARALGKPVRIALLKGRANYLCLHRLELAERDHALSGRRSTQRRALNMVRRWSLTTRSGDIAELPSLSEADPIWSQVTSTRENCLGVECPVFQRCHLVAARREAQAADVVIVNHYLLMADLLLKERGFGDLLPGADAIVIDEAHQLPDVAENFLGFAVSTRQLQQIARDLELELQTHRLADESIPHLLKSMQRSMADAHDALQSEHCDIAQWPQNFMESLCDVAASLASLTDRCRLIANELPKFQGLHERCADLAERAQHLIAPGTAAQLGKGVRWAEATRQGISIHFAPIDVAAQLGALIHGQGATWIFTSATLAVGDDFSHFQRRSGVGDVHTVQYGSPFNYAEQSLLYLPLAIDEPASPKHTQQVIDLSLPILKAAGGRAFLLFTSHRALRNAAAILREIWRDTAPYPLLVQGDAPRDLLLQKFREAGNAVLLGTGSFWEGVDVKGDALCVVVIDKLPFAVPDDPVMKARLAAIEEQGGNPFFDEQIPQAVLALKQGVGRLIRDSNDFGVIVLCDRRVATKSYGRLFLRSLPPMPRTEHLEQAVQFLKSKLADSAARHQPAPIQMAESGT